MDPATIVVSLVLGSGMFVTATLSILSYARSGKKTDSEIDLNKSEEQINQERWWTDQINDLRLKLNAEYLSSEKQNGMIRQLRKELNQVKDFFRDEHTPWDRSAQIEIERLGGHIGPPPALHVNGDGPAKQIQE